MVDWTTLLTWLIEGLIVACFVIAGMYVGKRLFSKEPGTNQSVTPSRMATDGESSQTTTQLPSISIQQALVSLPWPQHELSNLDAHCAFHFDKKDRLTVVLEMPVAMLEDSEKLAEAWIDSIGWARIEYQQKQQTIVSTEEVQSLQKQSSDDLGEVNPVQLQRQLDTVLGRLQTSAEQRRGMRSSVHEGLSEADQQG